MTILEVTSQTWTITLLGWAIVFGVLLFLVAIFLTIPKVIKWSVKRTLRGKGVDVTEHHDISAETNAAIATALHLYFSEMHDDESNIITIKQIQRRYSPWNSKLYGMNNSTYDKLKR